jgi:alkaline phosphatase D
MFLAGAATIVVATSCSGDGDDGDDATDASTTSATEPVDTTTAATTTSTTAATTTVPPVELPADPFTLGVASGDPTDASVILWTRLMGPDGALDMDDVPVTWELRQGDEVVGNGSMIAERRFAHSVHVDVADLEPNTAYTYDFTAGSFTSPTGRTRTMPALDDATTPMTLVFASCQDYEAGYYSAWRHAAADEPDLVMFLGDYMYETGGDEAALRQHTGSECETLDDYRARYALYKSDPDLQAAHAVSPWLVVWDDHEVDNDYADSISQDDDDITLFEERRLAAYQAWWEHQPVRLDPPTDGSGYRIWRDTSFGALAHIFMIDTRGERSEQPCEDQALDLPQLSTVRITPVCDAAVATTQSMMSAEQEAWLVDGLAASTATWNVLGNQVFMFGASVLPGSTPPLVINDTWDGYPETRRRLLSTVEPGKNLVVLTGDFHASAVGDLRADPFDTSLPVVGTEFMGTSISSLFPAEAVDLATAAIASNPHISWFDARKGYTRCTVTPTTWTTELRVVADVTDPESPVETVATFVVDAGTPGARRV